MMDNMMEDKNDMMDMSMRTTFFFGRTIPGGLLFQRWIVNSTGTLVGATIAVFLLALLYEALKSLREYLVYLDFKHSNSHTGTCTSKPGQKSLDDDSDTGELLDKRYIRASPKGFKFYSISVSMHLIQSVLHTVQVGYAYILMLVVMTFNGWLFLSICFGAGIGYLVFAKSRHLSGNFREQNEHCH